MKRAVAAFALMLMAGPWARLAAEQLALRHYDTRDGLAHGRVDTVYQDKKGYLWFGTWQGLSCFDGSTFVNYGTRDGLPAEVVTSVTEDARGRLWVGTVLGLARFVDDPREAAGGGAPPAGKRFVAYRFGDSHRDNWVYRVAGAADGSVWYVSPVGLSRLVLAADGTVKHDLVVAQAEIGDGGDLLADRQGRLWYVGNRAYVVMDGAGKIAGAVPSDPPLGFMVGGLCQDASGRLVAAFQYGVLTRAGPPASSTDPGWMRLPLVPASGREFTAVACDSRGRVWLGTVRGLVAYDGERERRYTSAQGLRDDEVRTIAEDREGHLWVGTHLGGLARVTGDALVGFNRADGLPDSSVGAVVEARDGTIYATTANGGVAEIAGDRAVPVAGSEHPPFVDRIWGRILQDRRGDWWIGGGEGLFRFPGPRLQLRKGRRFSAADGFSERVVFGAFYEDADGSIWFGASDGRLGSAVYRFDPSRARPPFFERFELEAAVGAPRQILRAGGRLWLAPFGNLFQLVDGKVAPVAREGLADVDPRVLYLDSRGWLWIGKRFHGVSVTREPGNEAAAFFNYSRSNGLSSDAVWCICEDALGRMYFGGARGIDRLDPVTGNVRHYGLAQGLSVEIVNQCHRDRHGDVWFGTSNGLWRIRPEKEAAWPPPMALIRRILAAGDEVPLPARGLARVPELSLAATASRLLIEYGALDLHPGRILSYQYKLEGADEDWSPRSAQRSVNFARLAPGSYRFLVRAIDQDGVASAEPAVVGFRVRPPFWRRWWFLAAVVAVVLGGAWMLHRQRVRRLVELERVRTHLATDLHDDIGSSLSQIAILSEVARRHLPEENATAQPLETIAREARDLVDAMADIVWAVDPRADSLDELVQRARRFAEEMCAARDIALHFSAPEADARTLDARVRRQTLLFLKESINNAVRHSGCRTLEAELRCEDGWLRARVSDDGRGFDASQGARGHGLDSLRHRAAELGGRCDVVSAPQRGTTIEFHAPLRPSPTATV